MAIQHAGMAVISERHKEVVNIRTAGAVSKCSAGNAIRILILPTVHRTIGTRLNSLKPLFGAPLIQNNHDIITYRAEIQSLQNVVKQSLLRISLGIH